MFRFFSWVLTLIVMSAFLLLIYMAIYTASNPYTHQAWRLISQVTPGWKWAITRRIKEDGEVYISTLLGKKSIIIKYHDSSYELNQCVYWRYFFQNLLYDLTMVMTSYCKGNSFFQTLFKQKKPRLSFLVILISSQHISANVYNQQL